MNNTKPRIAVTDYAFPDLSAEEQVLTPAGCEVVGRPGKTEPGLALKATRGQPLPNIVNEVKSSPISGNTAGA